MGITAYFQRHALDHIDPQIPECLHLDRIVGHEPELADTQVFEHVETHAVIPQIGGEAETFIRFDRIRAFVLEAIGTDLVEQPDAPSFLAQIEHDAPALDGDGAQRLLQLVATVAPHAVQRIAREAFGVGPPEHRAPIRHIPQAEHDMLLTGIDFLEPMHIEHTERRGQATALDESDDHGRSSQEW